ncbi:MAG TPA: hypothetical protein VJA21_16075 [Verrucomicrobiae bacterium]
MNPPAPPAWLPSATRRHGGACLRLPRIQRPDALLANNPIPLYSVMDLSGYARP